LEQCFLTGIRGKLRHAYRSLFQHLAILYVGKGPDP
jgi:hypothetical protein